MFSNTTFSPRQNVSTPCNSVDDSCPEDESHYYNLYFSTSVIIAILSPVAVAGNALILAAIWKKTLVRTPFHILLSGLAFTDLCTGLIAQPFWASVALMYETNRPRAQYVIIHTIGDSCAIYFISITVLLITLMSVERWLHMSRRSSATSRRCCFTVIVLLLIPIPAVVLRVLMNENVENLTYERHIYITIITLDLSCYLTTSFAYFKVYRIIRRHQQQVQAKETSQNFGRQAIDLAKYKKSVASMLYIVVLFSFCYIPFIVSSGVFINVPITFETVLAIRLSMVFLFLSSSLNPVLYVWRMNDIRNGVKQLFCRES
ncbi:histamine H2 receptor-like [Oculina patagonica]